jgi:tRNA(Arg) A34 adenosine deaminase TadA
MTLNTKDTDFLRQSFALADEAKQQGIHPFAAILVDDEDNVLMTQVNGYLPDFDMTGHAERKLMTRASKAYRPDFLAKCTMYALRHVCRFCLLGRIRTPCVWIERRQLETDHRQSPRKPNFGFALSHRI